MQRRLSALTDRQFDLLVIGGGICGLTIACDAAQRGLSVALVEQRDFGSGSTFNHLRTIHGGLRYLQSLDIARARASIVERRTLARIAPWAVTPTPFVLPLGRSLTKGPLALRAGFTLDRLIAGDRNQDLPASHHLPAGEVISPGEAVARFPELDGVPMSAAAVWYDYTTVEADRLTFAWAQAAASYGAALANYVEATALLTEAGRCAGATVRDGVTGSVMEVRARTVVNATGGSLDRLTSGPGTIATAMVGAMNLVMHQPAPSGAIGRQGSLGRNLFMVPWRGRAVFGTWESPRFDPRRPGAPALEDVQEFSRELGAAFGRTFDPATIALVHFGIVPAVRLRDGRLVPKGGDHIDDHARHGRPGLISVACTKYTTARAIADTVVTRLLTALGRSPVPSRTKVTPLPVPPADTAARLARAADEMVMTLEDAVVRRTTLGALGRPDEAALADAARRVGAQLGWDPDRQRREIDAVRAFYDGRDGRGSARP